MRKRHIPLFSLETKTEIAAFDFLGFSLQYEMIYSNVLNMLDLAGISLWAKDRGEDMPSWSVAVHVSTMSSLWRISLISLLSVKAKRSSLKYRMR